MASGAPNAATVAAELLSALDAKRPVTPLTSLHHGFDATAAYTVTAELRALRIARGETPVGRKIGFALTHVRPIAGACAASEAGQAAANSACGSARTAWTV